MSLSVTARKPALSFLPTAIATTTAVPDATKADILARLKKGQPLTAAEYRMAEEEGWIEGLQRRMGEAVGKTLDPSGQLRKGAAAASQMAKEMLDPDALVKTAMQAAEAWPPSGEVAAVGKAAGKVAGEAMAFLPTGRASNGLWKEGASHIQNVIDQLPKIRADFSSAESEVLQKSLREIEKHASSSQAAKSAVETLNKLLGVESSPSEFINSLIAVLKKYGEDVKKEVAARGKTVADEVVGKKNLFGPIEKVSKKPPTLPSLEEQKALAKGYKAPSMEELLAEEDRVVVLGMKSTDKYIKSIATKLKAGKSLTEAESKVWKAFEFEEDPLQRVNALKKKSPTAAAIVDLIKKKKPGLSIEETADIIINSLPSKKDLDLLTEYYKGNVRLASDDKVRKGIRDILRGIYLVRRLRTLFSPIEKASKEIMVADLIEEGLISGHTAKAMNLGSSQSRITYDHAMSILKKHGMGPGTEQNKEFFEKFGKQVAYSIEDIFLWLGY